MSIPYINFSTSNHSGVILGAQQAIQRRMNLSPDWTEIRCVAMARLIGGSTINDGIDNLGLSLSSENFSILSPTSPSQKFFFGLKDSSFNLPESATSKFIGIGAGEDQEIRFSTGRSGSYYTGGSGGANQNMGLTFGSGKNMRYGLSNGLNILSVLKSSPDSSTAPNFRFQPFPSEYGKVLQPGTNFCSPIGFIIKIQNKNTISQKITIFNYGSQTYVKTGNMTYSSYFRKFSDLSETVLDSELNIMGNNINAHSGGLAHTFDAPYPEWDLSGIDSFYLYWPFTNNRLILFNLKVKDYTL